MENRFPTKGTVGGPGGREGSREVFFHHTYSRITIKARNTVHRSIMPIKVVASKN
jgi:hypothetical protein